MVMIHQSPSRITGRLKYNVFYPVISSQGIFETEYQYVKERDKISCRDSVKLCSVSLSSRRGGADWRKMLLAC